MTAKVRIRIAKYGGDDIYSWAVFLDGHPVLTGLGHREAFFEQKALRERKGFK
jgi:hypothetical protein